MDFNALIVAVSANFPVAIGFTAQILVEAFINAMFTRHNDKRIAANDVKAQTLGNYISELYKENIISGTDLIKCKNLEAIAKLADKARNEQRQTKDSIECNGNYNRKQEYDFEWFLRFFERAGYATNEDMQKLWASVLNGEIDNRGFFSYKAIETLYHMSATDARLFAELAQYSIVTPYSECILPCSSELYEDYNITSPVVQSGSSDIYSILAAAYGINNERVMYLIESGLLSSLLTTSNFIIEHEPIFITNDHYAISLELKPDCNCESIEFNVSGYRFTSVARQLFGVIDTEVSLSLCLDYARLIARKYSEVEVHVYSIISIDKDGMEIDDEIDYLHNSKYLNVSKIQELNNIDDFDIL